MAFLNSIKFRLNLFAEFIISKLSLSEELFFELLKLPVQKVIYFKTEKSSPNDFLIIPRKPLGRLAVVTAMPQFL